MFGRWHKSDAALAAGALGAAWIVGLAWPSSLVGTATWSLAVLGVLFGLGAGIRRALRVELGVGEQLVLGGCAWIAVTGPLIALGICSRAPMLAIAGLASGFAIYDLATRPLRPAARPDKLAVVLWAVLATIMIVELLGVVQTRGNPFDDQVAYEGFVKRLLDVGNLIEPFSFRRVSAYGGQTSLLALAALRGDVQSTDLLDRGIFQWIAIIVVIDVARRRKVHVAAIAMIVGFVLCVSDFSINSAATWTGFAMFFAAYGFASREDVPRATVLVLAVLPCAAACTLRQNYLLPAVAFAALLLVCHLREHARATSWRAAWLAQRRTIALCVAVAAAVVVPYLIAAWLSNQTFLYPLQLGTMNAAAPLRPSAVTPGDELAFFITTALTSEPIRVWWILAPFMLLASDRRALRPWPVFLLAASIGFVFTVHSFMLSDSGNLWRYAWGYMTPLVVVFLVELSVKLPWSEDTSAPPLRLAAPATFLVWLAIVAQIVITRSLPVERLDLAVHNLKAALTLDADKDADPQLYRELQATLPVGARVAVLVDDPYLLDYARNQIFDLDLPGFASPLPGLPAYLGPERWRSYFLGLGIRYLAFVDSSYSSYLYRRPSWVTRMFSDGELWRFMGARMVDTLDTLQALSQACPVLFHRDGLVALDLGERPQPLPTTPDELEQVRRDRYAQHMSETELGNDAWKLASRSDVVFVPDGMGPSGLQIEPDKHAPVDAVVNLARKPVAPFRWITDRTHVRVHGAKRQHYRIKAWADIGRMNTVPSLRLVIDGTEYGRVRAEPDGSVELAGDATCHGWCDLYLVLSSMSEFWQPADTAQTVKLLALEWDEAP